MTMPVTREPLSIRWIANATENEWSPTDEELEALLSELSEEEQTRIRKLRKKEDRKRSLMGRMLLKDAVAQALGKDSKDIKFSRTKGSKPYIDDPEAARRGLNANVSHHGDWVVLGMEEKGLVGVDVSSLHAPRARLTADAYFEVMENELTPQEWRAVKFAGTSDPDLFHAFFMIWALKEAYTKAMGIGFALPFQRLELTLPPELLSAQYYRQQQNTERLPGDDRIRAKLDGMAQREWEFQMFKLDDSFVMGVAVGPHRTAVPSYKQAITRLMAAAQKLPQLKPVRSTVNAAQLRIRRRRSSLWAGSNVRRNSRKQSIRDGVGVPERTSSRSSARAFSRTSSAASRTERKAVPCGMVDHPMDEKQNFPAEMDANGNHQEASTTLVSPMFGGVLCRSSSGGLLQPPFAAGAELLGGGRVTPRTASAVPSVGEDEQMQCDGESTRQGEGQRRVSEVLGGFMSNLRITRASSRQSEEQPLQETIERARRSSRKPSDGGGVGGVLERTGSRGIAKTRSSSSAASAGGGRRPPSGEAPDETSDVGEADQGFAAASPFVRVSSGALRRSSSARSRPKSVQFSMADDPMDSPAAPFALGGFTLEGVICRTPSGSEQPQQRSAGAASAVPSVGEDEQMQCDGESTRQGGGQRRVSEVLGGFMSNLRITRASSRQSEEQPLQETIERARRSSRKPSDGGGVGGVLERTGSRGIAKTRR